MINLIANIDISIHSARVGGDRQMLRKRSSTSKFQSTPPVWAETPILDADDVNVLDFNPLRPCGRRLKSPSAPSSTTKFQSTPPVWAETVLARECFWESGISIHSARVGGDLTQLTLGFCGYNFNPLRPCGRRRDPA